MLRICIPAYNEAQTIGVLLWRIRTVLQEFSREYDVTVLDDGSTDGTSEVLEPYRAVMPLTVLRSPTRQGMGAAVEALVRHVAADGEYARRDAMLLLQGDFTDQPEHIPELVKRFEGGADVVLAARTPVATAPRAEQRIRRWGRLAMRPFLRLPAVDEPLGTYRLVRVAVLKELLRTMPGAPICRGPGRAAMLDFTMNLAPLTRRIESVVLPPRFDLRTRETRLGGWSEVVGLFHYARAARRFARPAPGARSASETPAAPMATVATDRPPTRRGDGAPDRDAARGTRSRPEREERRDRSPRPPRGERPERGERAGRPERPARAERGERPTTGRGDQPARAERPERPPRPPRPQDAAPAPVPAAASAPDATEETRASEPATAATTAAVGGTGAADPAAARKKRRRRRKRGTGSPPADGAVGNGDAAAPDAMASAPSRPADDGDDDADFGTDRDDDEGNADSAAASGADGGPARRKRRRRRRRPARHQNDDSGVSPGDAPAPPPD